MALQTQTYFVIFVISFDLIIHQGAWEFDLDKYREAIEKGINVKIKNWRCLRFHTALLQNVGLLHNLSSINEYLRTLIG